MALLEARNISVEFVTPSGRLKAVDDVSFTISEGEVMGLVGESGSGKTVACRAMLNLLPRARKRTVAGEATFESRNLMAMNEAELREVHGRKIGMIFQNPSSHLDPLMTVGGQVSEPLIYHEGLTRRDARSRAVELLRQVGIPDPARAVDAYPHQLSGGMRQRVMIASAVACRPKLLVADEPTTALDVTVQAQILRLLLDLRDKTGLAIVLITHDLAVIASTCDSVAVMYAGRIMESAPKPELVARPRHPYTMGLIRSQPSRAVPGRELPSIEGQLPAPGELLSGCRFHPRCAFAAERCRRPPVDLEAAGPDHLTACLRWREIGQAA